MGGDAPILIAGGETLLGAALRRRLTAVGHTRIVAGLGEPDLRDAADVDAFFERERPRIVFLVGGRSAGIEGNRRSPADLISDNLRVASNVIEAAHRHGVDRLLYTASSCIYPKACPQPMKEEMLLTGPLEPTSQSYAIAKLAGLEMCGAYARQFGDPFLSVIPGDMFGPDDAFDEGAHVLPSLMARIHTARVEGAPEVVVWGSGTPRRDFLYADDAAGACLFLVEKKAGPGPINVGSGESRSIRELAEALCDVVGFTGALRFDASRPDGAPLKALDSTRITDLGWRPETPFTSALRETYARFLERREGQRAGDG